MKRMLWKDIFTSISKSKGRFFSIMGLMFLGSFVLVGLKVTGPDMRATGESYVNEVNSADITVISPLGLDNQDTSTLDQTKGADNIEYGYLKDVVIKDSTESIRLYSSGEKLSGYHLEDGRLPKKETEIALDEMHQGDYQIGDTITFEEKADATGNTVLKHQEYQIVGFVYSGEVLSHVNMGQSTSGSGSLKGYGVVTKDAFDSDYYMLARMTFTDTKGVDPYSTDYTEKIQKHKDALNNLLKDQPAIRLATIKEDYQQQIDEGQQKIDDAKKQLTDAQNQLESGATQINDGKEELATAKDTLVSGEQQLADAKDLLTAGEGTLDEKWQQLQAGKEQLDAAQATLNNAATQLSEAATTLAEKKEQLSSGKSQLDVKEQELATAQKEFNTKNEQLQQAEAQYATGKEQLDAAQDTLDDSKNQLTSGKETAETKLEQISKQLEDTQSKLAQLNQQLSDLESQLAQPGLSEEEQQTLTNQKIAATEQISETTTVLEQLNATKDQAQSAYDSFIQSTYELGMAQINEKAAQLATQKKVLDQSAAEISSGKEALDTAQTQLNQGNSQLTSGKETLAANSTLLSEKEAEYQSALATYQAGNASFSENQQTYYNGMNEWLAGAEELDEKSAEYEANAEKIATAKEELATKTSELARAEEELTTKQTELDEKLPDVEEEISTNEDKLKTAQETLDNLKAPVYSLNSRREIPGSEGYKTYSTVSKIVDALANVFPIFLYFVAALVTSTTMTRFVDEERINSGTLKALGYSNHDIMKKFTFYGLLSSLLGTTLRIALGHTLLPQIVYNAYHDGFNFHNIEMHFDLGVTIVALLLAVISSVVPAWLVAARELKERPASLLLPKPPTMGSKIFLERIGFIWNKMSFTHKVTARNIFRYKKRMLMTIFGVAGAVALLFAGFSVQHSISGISDRQFGDIIHYDMIVAENDTITTNQEEEITQQLQSNAVKESAGIHYEAMSKIAGDDKDTQEIKLLVPGDKDTFKKYVTLDNRKTGSTLSLPDDGVIISERLASLLDVKVGDSITLEDASGQDRSMKVSNITEMYMGHFVFTSRQGYKTIFGQDYETNAYIVNLKDSSLKNTETQAADFMDLDGTQSVVQNTTLIDQVHTIVTSLDKIMKILIVIAALLGIVILYNLTNINVSERIRELSTIKVLGFYDKEVTMYIYRETTLLTGIGVLVGFGIGELLHRYIITVVPPDEVMFNPALGSTSFIVPALIITLVTVVLGLVVNHRLKHVDMLEALKSVD